MVRSTHFNDSDTLSLVTVSPPSPLQARETSGNTVNNFMARAGISAWPIRCVFIVFHHNCHVNSSQNPLPHPSKGVLHETKVAIETATRKMTYDNIRWAKYASIFCHLALQDMRYVQDPVNKGSVPNHDVMQWVEELIITWHVAIKLLTVLPDVSLACSGDGGDTRLRHSMLVSNCLSVLSKLVVLVFYPCIIYT